MKPLPTAALSRRTLAFVSSGYVTLVAVVLARTICVVLVLGILSPQASLANSLRAKSDSQVIQNRRADHDKLSRLSDQEMLQRFARLRLLVSVPAKTRGYYVHGVPARLHYLRPWSRLFLDRLSNQFRARFGKQLRITSLIRTAAYQKSLGRRNSNAASAFGEKRSSHLTGASLDISKKGMTRAQREWLRRVLTSLKRKGYLFAVEEFQQPNFHIMVYRNYPEYVKQIVTRQKSRKTKSRG